MVKKFSGEATTMRKAHKGAKAELAAKKQLAKARAEKMANASEISDVETVIPNPTLFSVDINIDNLKDHLATLKHIMTN